VAAAFALLALVPLWVSAAKVSLLLPALLAAYWLAAAYLAQPGVRLPLFLHLAHIALWTAPSFRVLQRKPIKPVVVGCALISMALALTLLWASPIAFDR
jgi:hypothetical protein